ncbi:zinc ribbon domain-containing protein [Ralstonia solanacearum]|uniref:zinc ribbon domain-containing protein n=1 Tax=Ralstonia solanacearum TaxID=305 RepID=UPI0018D09CEF|nr:zinc ribbon domain-containing protein [Ralstonia solanacearum]
MSSESDLHFSNNYRDLCIQSGTGAGFQFEFYCQCCSDTWRSPFAPYRSGQASGWMREAGGLLGGLFGGFGNHLDNAAEGLARAGWGTARDGAFKTAIASAEGHFHRCARCHRYACGQCWSADTGLCQSCAPDLAAEVRAARHTGTVQAATEAAQDIGKGQAAQVEVAADRALVCPECHTETHGAKFCPQCGHNLLKKAACGKCQAELPQGSRFCPECGQPAVAS